jgi:hypothetical protein
MKFATPSNADVTFFKGVFLFVLYNTLLISLLVLNDSLCDETFQCRGIRAVALDAFLGASFVPW